MTSTQVLVLVVILLAVIGAVAIAFIMRKRTEKLRAQFGPEYDRTVAETGNRFKAEAHSRKSRSASAVTSFGPSRSPIATVSGNPGGSFKRSSWTILARLDEADQLLARVMQARGYPPTDFENRAHGNFRGPWRRGR